MLPSLATNLFALTERTPLHYSRHMALVHFHTLQGSVSKCQVCLLLGPRRGNMLILLCLQNFGTRTRPTPEPRMLWGVSVQSIWHSTCNCFSTTCGHNRSKSQKRILCTVCPLRSRCWFCLRVSLALGIHSVRCALAPRAKSFLSIAGSVILHVAHRHTASSALLRAGSTKVAAALCKCACIGTLPTPYHQSAQGKHQRSD